jgi:flagellar biosynthesis chaperone FliJ
MKQLVVIALFAAMALASCVSKSRVEGVENQRDSLSMVVSAKDSLINIVFNQINSISDNLAQIRTREGLISLNSNEGINRPVEQINNDIAAIDRLLQDNKAKIASLQYTAAALRKANLRIDGLEKMIKDLNSQLAEKTNEVAQLRENLSQMGIEVKTLTGLVAEREARVDSLSLNKVMLEDQLHTIYYIVGQERELRDAQIIDKQGFIGRTLKVGNTANLDSFTKGDSRLLTEIPIGKKAVTVVTSHPEESYELITNADKVVIKLYIKDTERFWSSSKMLIISYK